MPLAQAWPSTRYLSSLRSRASPTCHNPPHADRQVPERDDDEPVQERPPVEVVVPALLAVAVRHVAVRVDGAAERGT